MLRVWVIKLRCVLTHWKGSHIKVCAYVHPCKRDRCDILATLGRDAWHLCNTGRVWQVRHTCGRKDTITTRREWSRFVPRVTWKAHTKWMQSQVYLGLNCPRLIVTGRAQGAWDPTPKTTAACKYIIPHPPTQSKKQGLTMLENKKGPLVLKHKRATHQNIFKNKAC